MPYLFDRLRKLDLRVDNPMVVLKERRERANTDVAVLVDRGPKHGSSVL
jgi:hypothetical protein